MANYAKKGHVGSLGAVVPMNNLNRHGQNPLGPQRPSPLRPRSSSPPAKRQKIEGPKTATCHFASRETSDKPMNRKRSFGSQSDSQHRVKSHSSDTVSTQATIQEYRDDNTVPIDAEHEIGGDGDGDVEVKSLKGATAPHRLQNRENQQYTTKMGSRSRRLDAPRDDAGASRGIHKPEDSSPDELALDEQDMLEKVPTRRIVTPSPSLSKKADIKRPKLSPLSHPRPQGPPRIVDVPNMHMDAARKIIGSGLRVLRAVSGRCGYEAEKAGELGACYLKLQTVSHILHPTDTNGKAMEQCEYLLVNLQKVLRVEFSSSPNCRVVKIQRSVDASKGALQKLILEFHSHEELDRFMEWARLSREGVPSLRFEEDASQDSLQQQLSHLMQEASKNTTIRNSNMYSTEPGDDVKLIKHNAAARAEQAEFAGRPRNQVREAKAKDLMKPLSTSLPSSDGAVVLDESRRRKLPRLSHTTRATFALESSPSDSDLSSYECWSVNNKGWEKRWRNSVVFPPHGKNRAIVDKDDIPRLDEGQFLNDNLIVFYLRYLQHSLEEDRPDLAQRIYFQNTFFYEKLKSARANQGINYDSVKAWTSKVDLFTKDYIIVPINEFSHWYVAIIYNTPRLLPSSDGGEETIDGTHFKDTITIEDGIADSGDASPLSLRSGRAGPVVAEAATTTTTQNDVINNLSRMSINSPEPRDSETKQPIARGQDSRRKTDEVIRESSDCKADVGRISLLNDTPPRKKTTKRHSIPPRKYNVNQPRIITLDSLGLSHSPACNILKQYLVAELEDKKGIAIPKLGSLGMTAKPVPEQTNHCDCGLFLLGYIQEFLKAPDAFVRSLLQHDDRIDWDLRPSQLRNDIRDLLFQLQKEQQEREDSRMEAKRKAALAKADKNKVNKRSPSPKDATPTGDQVIQQQASELIKEEVAATVEAVDTPTTELPVSQTAHPESRPPSDPEGEHHVPGFFPQSPATESTRTKGSPPITSVDDSKEVETEEFIPLLPSSTCGSSPTKPMVVEDSPEHKQMNLPSSCDSERVNSSLEVAVSPIKPRESLDGPDSKHGKQDPGGAPIASPFAGRQPGDKMASAKLREGIEAHVVVDISD
ncbi:cysteine proteinase [Durotheca rogersii]|uniref:cysteine proteinase n=1 Tax=Durotheca rogersii TaxID=419775 RepID=UPI00221F583F|nr:cysteine proteinase [Durotheca rogersii]KAI5862767.1 cysteine proteinase [Durotheca rogersii]